MSKRIGKKDILSDITLATTPGEIVGLVGPNGAGKTSLMKLIAGYNFPTAGSIRICGHDVRKEHVAAVREAAFLVEGPGLYPGISGQRHMEMFCDARGIPREKIQTVSDFLNFAPQLKNRTRTYSLGMKERLGLALCWVSSPKLMVLDEPLNGLDPDGIFLLRRRLEQVTKGGTTVLISSHLLDELQKVASRIVFIKAGRLIGDETTDNLEKLEDTYRSLFPEAEGGCAL